jgi:hypothetical protein
MQMGWSNIMGAVGNRSKLALASAGTVSNQICSSDAGSVRLPALDSQPNGTSTTHSSACCSADQAQTPRNNGRTRAEEKRRNGTAWASVQSRHGSGALFPTSPRPAGALPGQARPRRSRSKRKECSLLPAHEERANPPPLTACACIRNACQILSSLITLLRISNS